MYKLNLYLYLIINFITYTLLNKSQLNNFLENYSNKNNNYSNLTLQINKTKPEIKQPILNYSKKAVLRVNDFLENSNELSLYLKDDVLLFMLNHLTEIGNKIISSNKKSIPQTYVSRLDYLKNRIEDYFDLIYPPEDYLGNDESNAFNEDADTKDYSNDVNNYLPHYNYSIYSEIENILDNENSNDEFNFSTFSNEEKIKFNEEKQEKLNYGINSYSVPIEDKNNYDSYQANENNINNNNNNNTGSHDMNIENKDISKDEEESRFLSKNESK